MEYVTIVAMLALVQYFVFGGLVGKARAAGGVKAPAVSGDATFERTHRAHQNTLEQLVIFLPAIYATAYYLYPLLAAVLGIMFIIGRAIYFRGYVNDPAKRGPGAIITMFSNMALVIAAIVGAVIHLN